MKRIGTAVFLIGIIIASIFAAPTPPKWAPFILGLIITVAGGLMARKRSGHKPKKADADAEHAGPLTIENMVDRLEALAKDLKALAALSLESLIKEEAKAQADLEHVQTQLNHLFEGRHTIEEEEGMQAYAEIFSHLAILERALNRAWSAMVDGYPKEAHASLQRAGGLIPEAESIVRKYCEAA
ncbi:MAG: hypothetical protein ABII00_04095 [Elusimicrobiota bacterium]